MDGLDEAGYEQAEEVIGQLVSNMLDYLYDYIMDKFATHVARRLVCLVTGRNVLPSNKQQDAKKKTCTDFLDGSSTGQVRGCRLAARRALSPMCCQMFYYI